MKPGFRTFKIKLWLYFVLFAALIFTVLWLLQTVFIQRFYNDMLIDHTKTVAKKIVRNSSKENFSDMIDELSLSNSILVYITDTDGAILYSSDQFKRLSVNNGEKFEDGKEDKDQFVSEKHFGEGGRHQGNYRNLPDGFEDFLQELHSSSKGVYEKTSDGLYIYGTYINSGGEQYVLYISTTLDAVGSTVEIIRNQLIWVTVISLVIGFILAWLIARSFARPVANLTKKAEHLGEESFPKGFKKGFCSELDELSDVLDETSQKLEKSKEFQRELLANVSHDLRTPLTMIKGYAEMIRDISRTDEEQCNSDIEVIVREADRLSAMVNEILEYSEMQSVEQKTEFELVDFGAVVKRVCDNFESLYHKEGGHIETQLEDNIMINGHAGKLERAVYNLLDNAMRHNGDSKLIRVHLKKENGQAKLLIIDHGNGIPEEQIESIWDRYYTYRQRDKKGVSRLGLAIVKQIVKMHGGICAVESTVGSGSTFMIMFEMIS